MVTVGSANLLDRRFVVDQVLVSGLVVHARRLEGGTLNLLRLLPAAVPPGRVTPVPWTVEKPTQWSVGEIKVDESAVVFRDETIEPAFEATVEELSLSVANLSNARGAQATMDAAWLARPGQAGGSSSTVAFVSIRWGQTASSRSTGSSPGGSPPTTRRRSLSGSPRAC